MNEDGAKIKEPLHNSKTAEWVNWIKSALEYYKDACSAQREKIRILNARIKELEAAE